MADLIRDAGLLWIFFILWDQYLVMIAKPWECRIPLNGWFE